MAAQAHVVWASTATEPWASANATDLQSMATRLSHSESADVRDDVLSHLARPGYSFESVARQLDVTVGTLADDRVTGFACWIGDSPVALVSDALSGSEREAEFAHQLAHLVFAYSIDVGDGHVHKFVDLLLAKPTLSMLA